MLPTIAPYPSSWFTEFSPEDSLGVAAASVLSGRLVAVLRHHPLAVSRAGESVEHVHHLRVAARRSSAALAAFGKVLPKKLRDQADDLLRSIRKSAGLARDWDVFLFGIGSKQSGSRPAGDKTATSSPKGSELLEGLALAKRVAAQRELADSCPNFGKLFPKLMEKIAESVSQSTSAKSTVSSLAESVLNEAFCDFCEEISLKEKNFQGSQNPKSGPEHLHKVRILGKRVRYLMEIFWHCLPKGVRHELYPLVEEAQELLGQINDHYRALAMLRELSDEVKMVSTTCLDRLTPLLKTLSQRHEKQITEKLQAYQQWCIQWEKVEGKWDKD